MGIAPHHWYVIFYLLGCFSHELASTYISKINRVGLFSKNDTPLQDIFAEIYVAYYFFNHYPIVPDNLTSTIGKSGQRKNADLFVNNDFFVEIKNYSISKTHLHVQLTKAQKKLFGTDPSKSAATKGMYEVVPSKGKPKHIKHNEDFPGYGVFMASNTTIDADKIKSLIKQAEIKFRASDRAVVVIAGLPQIKNAAIIVHEYFRNKSLSQYPIKAIVLMSVISWNGVFDNIIYEVAKDDSISDALRQVYVDNLSEHS